MAYRSDIHYDPSLNGEAGYVEISDPQGEQPLRERDRQTLLYVLFQILYTKPGRDLMRDNKPIKGQFDEAKKETLRRAFQEMGITDLKVRESIIDAHEAAQNWADAFKAGAKQNNVLEYNEKIYLQQMAFITWSLWEDAKGHEFSMGW
jgi:hypothetical protein